MHQPVESDRDYTGKEFYIFTEPKIREALDSIFASNNNNKMHYEVLEVRLVRVLDDKEIRTIEDITSLKKYFKYELPYLQKVLVEDVRPLIYRVDERGFVYPRSHTSLQQIKIKY